MKGKNKKTYTNNDKTYYQCCTCKGYFLVEGFYNDRTSHYGISNRCIECAKINRKATYHNHAENNRKKGTDFYAENSEAVCQKSRARYYLNKNTIRLNRTLKRLQNIEEARIKERAHAAIHRAVLSGEKNPACKCEVCEDLNKGRYLHHHWSYLPEHHLDTIEMCISCHIKHHKTIIRLHKSSEDNSK